MRTAPKGFWISFWDGFSLGPLWRWIAKRCAAQAQGDKP